MSDSIKLYELIAIAKNNPARWRDVSGFLVEHAEHLCELWGWAEVIRNQSKEIDETLDKLEKL